MNMSKFLKITLASAMLIAGSSMAFAADRNDGGANAPGGFSGKSRSSEQQEQFKLDYGTTGSISNCDMGYMDRDGNCVVDRDNRSMR
jgi:hypothetical protein